MKITNKFNVPETLVALASRDYYSKVRVTILSQKLFLPHVFKDSGVSTLTRLNRTYRKCYGCYLVLHYM